MSLMNASAPKARMLSAGRICARIRKCLGAEYPSLGTRSRRPAMKTTPNIRARQELERLEVIAGNGLLGRRAFLRGGAAFAAAVTGYTVARSAAAEPLKDDPWSLGMGAVTPPLQTPSRFEKHVVRTLSNPNNELRNSHARTPHHLLNGTITPNSMHFSINHSGLPDIDPEKHRLVIHGLVRQPLVFTVESLSRYPMESRMAFVECSGNR